MDATHQKYLQRQDLAVQLKNKRAIAPHLWRETEARLDAAQARVLQARHELDHTRIYCPFTARVESVKAHQSQMVTAHLSIATLTDMEAFELPISVDPRELRWLDRRIRLQALRENSDQHPPEVKIAWSVSDHTAPWHGHVARFERMDEVTRTARMIVEIRAADMAVASAFSPHDAASTISIGMHCRAELPAEPLAEAILVPWHAIHEDRWVYVFEPVDDETNQGFGRLGRREVSILRTLGDEVLVDFLGREGRDTCQLKPGEQLVVSRLADPVLGMRVALQRTPESTRDQQARPSSAALVEFTTLGPGAARLAMSDKATKTGPGGK